MTETTAAVVATDAEAARHYIIDGINSGLSIQSAVNAAIAAGYDEIVARTIGRNLRDDMIKLKKKRALGGVPLGLLWMILAVGFFGATVVFRIPFGGFIALVGFIAGIVQMILSMFAYFGVESEVR